MGLLIVIYLYIVRIHTFWGHTTWLALLVLIHASKLGVQRGHAHVRVGRCCLSHVTPLAVLLLADLFEIIRVGGKGRLGHWLRVSAIGKLIDSLIAVKLVDGINNGFFWIFIKQFLKHDFSDLLDPLLLLSRVLAL